MDNKINVIGDSTQKEIEKRKELYNILHNMVANEDVICNELLMNIGLFISRQNMSRILWMNELYKKILDVHGIIAEFGVRWGQNLALFESFRGIYEPFNYNRKIIGFDTFEGFASIDEKDGMNPIIKKGSYNISNGYEDVLAQILDYHESESPISHKKKYELIKGNAVNTVKEYLEENPHTIFAFVYFDFDIYKPTYESLKSIKNHLTKGSVIGFDELNFKEFPGETLALKEVFGLDKYPIKRSNYCTNEAYIIIE